MREWCIAAVLLAAACDRAGYRSEGSQVGPGIVTSEGGEADAGEEPRLGPGLLRGGLHGRPGLRGGAGLPLFARGGRGEVVVLG